MFYLLQVGWCWTCWGIHRYPMNQAGRNRHKHRNRTLHLGCCLNSAVTIPVFNWKNAYYIIRMKYQFINGLHPTGSTLVASLQVDPWFLASLSELLSLLSPAIGWLWWMPKRRKACAVSRILKHWRWQWPTTIHWNRPHHFSNNLTIRIMVVMMTHS